MSRKTQPVMCPGDRALSGARAGCREDALFSDMHAIENPHPGARFVPHAAADARDVFHAV